MDCSNMNQKRCGCQYPQMMMQPDRDCSCGEPPTIIPVRPIIEPRREGRAGTSCDCAEGGMLMPSRPMPNPDCGAVMPAKPRCDCPDTSVGGMEMYPAAMGYIPWQQWQQTYALDRGLSRGTIFPDLDLPFVMGRCR